MSSVLDTRRGMLTLVLLCAVQFLDIVDSSITNVALPSIRQDLGFSQQGLQWVLSGYVLTFGGSCSSADAPRICSGAAGFSSRARPSSRSAR